MVGVTSITGFSDILVAARLQLMRAAIALMHVTIRTAQAGLVGEVVR
ncbi:MAG: hypothetical protein Q7T84_02300 [Phenylobacterium sp.]|nr:hypothetical protein [Phenylobacterium sp.]MDO9430112.1 hypothetical protein [Phenylobacterium sp.]